MFLKRNSTMLVAYSAPVIALTSAISLQYIYKLTPCDLCIQQRIPYYIGVSIIIFGLIFKKFRDKDFDIIMLTACVLWSGCVAIYHVAVERHLILESKPCGLTLGQGSDMMSRIMSAPMIPCDEPQWVFLGVSMAGWNAIFAIVSGLACLTYVVPRCVEMAKKF